jgi:hypothetical protein
MAYTTSYLVDTVVGNQRVKAMRVTADAATGIITTGLKDIEFFSVANQSSTAATEKWAMNELSAGTAAAGYLFASGATSGDEWIVVCYGS